MFSVTGVLGAVLALAGSAGFFFFPAGLSAGIKSALNLAEDGPLFAQYMNPPLGPVSTFYLCAIANPKATLQGGRASFQVKGPYRFNTTLVRKRIKFIEDGQVVSFDSARQLATNEEHSADFDEPLWLVNPLVPGVAAQIKSLLLDRIPFRRLAEPIVFNGASVLLDQYGERLIMRTTPRSVFEGRKIEMLEAVTGLARRFGVESLLPPGPPQNVFGVVYIQNRTIEKFELWTGVGSTAARFAEVRKFNGKERLDGWRGRCNAIAGTNGELHKPFLETGKPLKVFLGALCRSLSLDPVGERLVPTKSGVMALEYEFTGRLFQGARSNPDNECYCKDKRTYDCQYDGLAGIGPCFLDSPIYLTRPQFEGVDPKIRDLVDWKSLARVDSEQPDSALPSAQSFKIEPITGAVLAADVTLMSVVKVVRQPHLRELAKVQNLSYVPLFVANDRLELPFSLVWKLYFLQKLNDYHKPIMAGTGLAGLGMLALKLF
jgi:hypothetical protein